MIQLSRIIWFVAIAAAAVLLPSRAAAQDSSLSAVASGALSAEKIKFENTYGRLPLSFELNQGQADSRVKFLSRSSGYGLFLTSAEAVLTLSKATPNKTRNDKGLANSRTLPSESAVLRVKLIGANPEVQVSGTDEQPGKSNYFIGNDPAKWCTNVPTYAKVEYEGIWPGVDLVYYGNQGQLECDFIVAPGANPRAIRMSFGGLARARHALPLQVDRDGNLVLRTSGGEVQFHKPIVYQQVGDARQEIAARYVLHGKHQISFEVAAYDASKRLIIDPVLTYSTYLGGGNDLGTGIAVDASGNAYVTGFTLSTNFPTKNPLQTASGGGQDAFVAKLDPTGSSLVYSTYLGGSGDDFGTGIAVDASGNAYVTGYTLSTNFPTKNPLQAASGGGQDAFVAKLNPTGSSLVYSTYLGGSGDDFGFGIAVDASGNAYVTGSFSINFPATAGAFQTSSGGNGDAFVTKLNAAGSALVYSTYLGGSGNDRGNGIAVDASGNAYVTGYTFSTNFPTKNPSQAASGGGQDAFVAKLDPTGSSLVYSTYLGGSGDDFGNGIAVDGSGNAYVAGLTKSANFPTASPFQGACGACSSAQPNAFVSRLNSAGSALVYSTYLGGSGNGLDGDFGNAIAVDAANNAYVTGFTSSPNFPLASPIQSNSLVVIQNCYSYYYGSSTPCGNTAFVTKLNPTGFPLVYSTYLGASGGNFEEGFGIAVDASGNAYVTGRATSNFPLTPGALQISSGANGDAFVAKISPNDAPGFSLSSFSLGFPDEGIGGTTAPQQIALTNTGSAMLTIASIVSSGDFAETNTCGSGLAGGTGCTINVTFTPTAGGARTGTITITDSAASSPQKVTLSGNGIGSASTLSPTSLSFGNQTQGTTSAPQSVTLTNVGSTTLAIISFAFSGANAADFTLASTNCYQGQSLAVGASCTFNIVFAPQAVGNRSASLQIFDNSPQSPRTVPLTGVGVAPPTVALSVTSLTFAAQVVGTISQGQSITLTTSGSGTLLISASGISTTSNDFSSSSNCVPSVAGGGSCTITVTFMPTAPGHRTGTLVIVSNAANGTQMVSLSGFGTVKTH